MEVLLESLEGTALEEGSLISVRCGNERRQARLKPGQTFRFPQAAKAGPMGHALKVEALQCLGERIFYLDATEGSKPVILPNGSRLNLRVREDGSAKPAPPPAGLDPGLVMATKGGGSAGQLRAALQATEYLEKHELTVLLQDLLKGLLNDMPDDPLEYIQRGVNRAQAKRKAKRLSTDVRSGVSDVEELIAFLKEDRENLICMIAYLPDWLVDDLLSDSFIASCMEQFEKLDADHNGTLDANELIPVVCSLCRAHPYQVNRSQAQRFADIFDSDQNGVISRDEFVDFARTVMVVSYMESPEGRGVREAAAGAKKVDQLLDTLRQNRGVLQKVIPHLPEWLTDFLSNPDFVDNLLDDFDRLDVDQNGVLDATELYPLIVEMSAVHPLSVDQYTCSRFLSIFDTDGNGVISRIEFANFVRTVFVICFLETPEGAEVLDTIAFLEGEEKVENLLAMLQSDRKNLDKVLPYLPQWLVGKLCAEDFAKNCIMEFTELDVDKSGALDALELYPVVVRMSEAHPFSVDVDQCSRFLSIFDTDGNGVISIDEFLEFVQFVMIMSYLETPEGQDIVQEARASISGKGKADVWLKLLAEDKKNVEKVLPFLDPWLVDLLTSESFGEDCLRQFDELDLDRNGTLDAMELFPAVVALSGAHPVSVTVEHCKRLLAIFDEDQNGVISRDEFLDFACFTMICAFLETETGHECRKIMDGEKQTNELLAKLKQGKEYLFEVVPYLPGWLVELVMSEEFAQSCLQRFSELDADGNGTLDPTELFPVVVELSAAHPFTITNAQCVELCAIFDQDKNGVLSRSEFVDFARFVMVVGFLETSEGEDAVYAAQEGMAIEAGERQVEDLLQTLRKGKEGVQKVLPFLPQWLVDGICSDSFAADCQQRFESLDADQNGYLDPKELYPVVVDMSAAHPFSVSLEHCKRLVVLFDTDKNGVISRSEFADFAMFVMIACYLETEEGKSLARTAESPVVQRLQQNAEQQQAVVQKLAEENEELRFKTQDLEAKLRAVEEKIDRLAKN